MRYTTEMGLPAAKPSPLERLIEAGEDARLELLNGVICSVETTGEHSDAQAGVVTAVRAPYHRKPGGGDLPGGWWIYVECNVQLNPNDVFRPDLSGWRRDRFPVRPTGFPIHQTPDWVCDVLSPSTESRDLGYKRRAYHKAKVDYYWIVDVERQSITILRWSLDGYVVLEAEPVDGILRAPPFEAAAIDWNSVFGKDG